MDAFIEDLQYASTTVQSLGVSALGLIGVFATLAVFFIIIALSNRFSKKA
mgnify:CR=1 FL=1